LSASETPGVIRKKDCILKGYERCSVVLIIDDLASLQDAAQSRISPGVSLTLNPWLPSQTPSG
ncbi:MAG: hypothetical protein L0220_20770, partial [Acidobacteria bacterium]|nr:hypothetical protein [Acidobacteriota bacterium]